MEQFSVDDQHTQRHIMKISQLCQNWSVFYHVYYFLSYKIMKIPQLCQNWSVFYHMYYFLSYKIMKSLQFCQNWSVLSHVLFLIVQNNENLVVLSKLVCVLSHVLFLIVQNISYPNRLLSDYHISGSVQLRQLCYDVMRYVIRCLFIVDTNVLSILKKKGLPFSSVV